MNKISEEFLLPESISFVPVDSILCTGTASGGTGGQGTGGGTKPGIGDEGEGEEGGDEDPFG